MKLIINAICLLIALAWCVKSNWDYEPIIVSIGLFSTLIYQGVKGNKASIKGDGNKVIQGGEGDNNATNIKGNENTVIQQGAGDKTKRKKKAESESMSASTPLSKVRALIAEDKLSAALKQMQILLDNSPLLDELIQQSGRFHHIHRQIRLGTVSQTDATLTRNQIRESLLDLLREVEEQQGKQPAIRQEMEKFVANIQKADKIYNIDHIDNANFS